MADEKTLFELPTDPEEFGVILEPARLRRLNFSALEFQTMRRAIIEYIKTYYPTRFNDFVANNGIIMMTEVVAYIAGILSQRSDILADEGFLPTAQTTTAVEQHLFLINNKIRRATPAVVDIEVSIGSETPLGINIQPGLRFNITGADGNPVTYEIYRAPGDFTSNILIPPGSRGVIAFGIEGSFVTPLVVESAGGAGQQIVLTDTTILEDPITVTVQTGSTVKEWRKVATLEQSDPTDEVFEFRYTETGGLIKFGNDKAGKAPLAGQIITVEYRIGGGTRGRIPANAINEVRPIVPLAPATAPVEVLFRNPNPSNGGENQESVAAAKARAPLESAALGSATSGEDYAVLAKQFNHPIYGSVLKAVATVRTSINANIVEVYCLAAGPDNVPVTPSLGLKRGLETFFDDINVLTDEVRVLDGAIKGVNVKANIVISRNADPTSVKNKISQVITDFFHIDNFDLGKPLFVSRLVDVLHDIDGVQYVDIFEPADNILPSKLDAASTPATQVGFNELLVLGNTQIRLYSEPSAS
jgi:phage-related baseplate assembly protein